MKYFIKTFGCQMNEADSEKLAAVLEKQGYKLAGKIEQADVVIVNTCSVRESAENRVLGLVNNLSKVQSLRQKADRQKAKVILTGCMLGSALGERKRYRLSQLKKKLPYVDEFKTIKELLGSKKVFPKHKKKKSAFVPIMRGCNNFCSYCVVPYAKGRERSRSFKEVVCQVEGLIKKGYEEITLLGQNVNSYQPSFAKLLKRLCQIKGLKKIKFLTSNPWDLTDEIIEAMKLSKIDRYLHLPVQSGNDEVLKKMNRKYTSKQYLDLIRKIKKEIPGIEFGTDIIVGFPGETKKQFQNTVKLCKKVGFKIAFIGKYSPRPGTAAFKLKDNVSPPEKKRRWQILNRLINKK